MLYEHSLSLGMESFQPRGANMSGGVVVVVVGGAGLQSDVSICCDVFIESIN